MFQLPKVNFEKYGVSIPEFVEEEQKVADPYDLSVRGRMFDQSKPETFNQVDTYYNIIFRASINYFFFSAVDL